MEIDDIKPPLTIAAMAASLGVSRKTARRILQDGEIPFMRLGPRIIRVRAADLDDFMTAKTV
jgi:excisionase family DNA binding protein